MKNATGIWGQLMDQKTAVLAEIGKSSSDNVKLRRLTEWIRRELDLETKHKGLLTEAERLIAEQLNGGSGETLKQSGPPSDSEAKWAFKDLSKQERVKVARRSYLKHQEGMGIYYEQGKGKTVYRRKSDGIVLGITFSIDYKEGKSWFLGLPKDSFQEAVLLCQCGPRSVKVVHLRKYFCEKYVRYLSVDKNDQAKFNILREGNKWLMEIPQPTGAVEVTNLVEAGELVCNRYDYEFV